MIELSADAITDLWFVRYILKSKIKIITKNILSQNFYYGGENMCGIVGYIGKNRPEEVLLSSLKRLEYRGYDSSGIAIMNSSQLQIVKSVGKIDQLEEKVGHINLIDSHVGIAHTRWATHGGVTLENAHPHTMGSITIVHNGIIENAPLLKEKLVDAGYQFVTETDTEVLAALLDYYYEGDILQSIQKCREEVIGSYALGILVKGDCDHLYAIRRNSPLIIGVSEQGHFIASDISALLDFTNQYMLLEEEEIAILGVGEVAFFNASLQKVKKDILTSSITVGEQTKNGYPHYMLKEIMEESILLDECFQDLLPDLETIPDISQYEEIHIVACGSAYYAGMIGKFLLEEKSLIPVRIEVASEYRYCHTIYRPQTLIILISQSGETADTIAVLDKARENQVKTLGIVNVENSTLARGVDEVIYTRAGVEVAVATTKAYLLQVVYLSLLALKAGVMRQCIPASEVADVLQSFRKLPEKLKVLLSRDYSSVAREICQDEDSFFIGRGIDYAMCLEGSLKLKEVSYIHSEAYQAGELKHGTISLVKEGMPVIAIITDLALKDKTVSNLVETSSRGAKCIAITTSTLNMDGVFEILIPSESIFIQSLLVVPVLQLIAYEVAKLRECEIDQPRNLAKSVTVE